MKNLAEALAEELELCQKLLPQYIAIGPVGAFGHAMIQHEIKKAIKASSECNCADMLRALAALKGCS